jgi:glycerate 2-kinase
MNILIAPDKFRGSLSSTQAAEAIFTGIKEALPDLKYQIQPISDGGEGTLDIITKSQKGQVIEFSTFDPIGRPITSPIGLINVSGQRICVIESSYASGLRLLSSKERNPLKTSSYGTGLLIQSALEYGCDQIVVGLGGTGTIDAGMGLLQALGAKFISKKHGVVHPFDCKDDIIDICLKNLDCRLQNVNIIAACDVDIPLLGENGSVKTFGVQKGALAGDLKNLERRLIVIERLIRGKTNRYLGKKPYSGAGGGMAFSLEICGAKLKAGTDVVFEFIDIETKVQQSHLIITGEGRLDSTTLLGKSLFQLAKLAKSHNVPCVAIVGTIEPGFDYRLASLDGVLVLATHPYDIEYILANSFRMLVSRTTELAELLKICIRK